jgi:hypothetical protein
MAGSNSSKDKLAANLENTPARPAIRRGQGVVLSTEQESINAPTHQRTDAITHNQDNALTPESDNAITHNQDNALSQNLEIALTHQRTDAKEAKRVNRGYKLREDLIKDCKRIAIDEDKMLYEVMEEAIEQYIERKKHNLLEKE